MKESGHYYDGDGNPCHFQPTKRGAKNALRPTTAADAARLGLYPSVSTVISILDKRQLKSWGYRQLTDTCAKNPYSESFGDLDGYHEKIMEEAFREVGDAADAGTIIHDQIHAYYTSGYDPERPVYLPQWKQSAPVKTFVEPVAQWMKDNGIEPLEHETVVVDKRNGYAGKFDLRYKRGHAIGIGDFKTRKTKPGKKVEPWDEQPMQIAAYFQAQPDFSGFGDGEGFNLYVSTTEPGRVEGVFYSAQKLYHEFYLGFYPILKYWQYRNGWKLPSGT